MACLEQPTVALDSSRLSILYHTRSIFNTTPGY